MATFYDITKKKSITTSTNSHPASFTLLSGNVAYKIGDIIHVTVELVDIAAPTSAQLNTHKDIREYFQDFFIFKSDSDPNRLNMTLQDARRKGGKGDEYTLKYLLNLSDLNSGDKEVNVYAFEDTASGGAALKSTSFAGTDPELTEKRLNIDPLSFYLNQSILDRFQDNIANAGIATRTTGLSREDIDFPSFLPVGLQPINPFKTSDVALWEVIRDGTNSLSFNNYSRYMDFIFCGGINPFEEPTPDTSFLRDKNKYDKRLEKTDHNLSLPFNNVDAYRALKVATEAFVVSTMVVSGDLDAGLSADYLAYLEDVKIKANIKNGKTLKILPYLALIRAKLPDIDIKFHPFEDALSKYIDDGFQPAFDACYGLLASKLKFPVFLELIWSYWHEESMMVQGISAVARRFQNIRGGGSVDPLANIEIGPLRPLNNLMWGYVQDEQHRLSVRRRAYEYDHHYGITLQGTAVQGMRMADSRSKFIEAFHTLLSLCVKFYQQYDDTTVVADGFPIMNALKEVHMILSEGAHNQYGDLPSTARIEMLMQLYLLARPEFREFLPTRQMVAYPEPWMDRVAVLNQIHNWTNTNVLHFRDLGVFGEQIILSIRFGAWSDVINRDQAANWAIFWRPQIQNYIHAYRAVTGVDIQQPSVHLLRRLKEQNSKIRI
jgi:hypothetical protein